VGTAVKIEKNDYASHFSINREYVLDVKSLQKLLKIGKLLLAESDVDKLLSISLDIAIQFSGAERGMILLFNDEGNVLSKITRNFNFQKTENQKFNKFKIISSKKNHKISSDTKKNLLFISIPKSDEKLVHDNNSILFIPIHHNGNNFGVIYIENSSANDVFNIEMQKFITAFADFISLAAYNVLEKNKLQKRMDVLEAELRSKYKFESIVGSHPQMLDLLKLVSQIADSDAIVLIQGESGSGKELIARALHFNSSRRNKPFVPINCGALSENLLESELFGHVRGAFTGAINEKTGWFESANGGSIFLDEVGEMSPALQVKLLRVLQTGEYCRVGESKIRYTDVRIIAATNKNLKQLVEEDNFREDLYYRLNVFDLLVPPLRERKSDIPLMIDHFLQNYKEKYEKEYLTISREAHTVLLAYDYPGNCRELENIIQHALLLAEGKYIEVNNLPRRLLPGGTKFTSNAKLSPFKISKQNMIEKFELDYIIDCLKTCNGNISRAATIAGINVKNFYQKMTKYDIDAHAYKASKIN